MTDLKDYGFRTEMTEEKAGGFPARVMAVHKERYALVWDQGELYGRLKAGVYYNGGEEEFPTVGDFVMISYNQYGDSQIIRTLERKSRFARNDFSGHAAGYVKTIKEQVVAANFDYVFIMQSLNHDFNKKRLERYLTLAWQSGAVPVVVLTKADLSQNIGEQLEKAEKVASAGAEAVDVVAVSAKTGYGLDSLAGYLEPRKTIVFLGSSGVGKSSLVNALAGEKIMDVKEIREDDSKGRHTTTHRQLIMMSCGAMIIDTPGMRELGMWDAAGGIDGAFADVEEYLGTCRFSDCRHRTEPGCAVRAAIESGELSQERWDSYLKIRKELNFVDSKSVSYRDKNTRGRTAIQSKKRNRREVGEDYDV